jgi:hypothetical protein
MLAERAKICLHLGRPFALEVGVLVIQCVVTDHQQSLRHAFTLSNTRREGMVLPIQSMFIWLT